jgi:hypothetical protein
MPQEFVNEWKEAFDPPGETPPRPLAPASLEQPLGWCRG